MYYPQSLPEELLDATPTSSAGSDDLFPQHDMPSSPGGLGDVLGLHRLPTGNIDSGNRSRKLSELSDELAQEAGTTASPAEERPSAAVESKHSGSGKSSSSGDQGVPRHEDESHASRKAKDSGMKTTIKGPQRAPAVPRLVLPGGGPLQLEEESFQAPAGLGRTSTNAAVTSSGGGATDEQAGSRTPLVRRETVPVEADESTATDLDDDDDDSAAGGDDGDSDDDASEMDSREMAMPHERSSASALVEEGFAVQPHASSSRSSSTGPLSDARVVAGAVHCNGTLQAPPPALLSASSSGTAVRYPAGGWGAHDWEEGSAGGCGSPSSPTRGSSPLAGGDGLLRSGSGFGSREHNGTAAGLPSVGLTAEYSSRMPSAASSRAASAVSRESSEHDAGPISNSNSRGGAESRDSAGGRGPHGAGGSNAVPGQAGHREGRTVTDDRSADSKSETGSKSESGSKTERGSSRKSKGSRSKGGSRSSRKRRAAPKISHLSVELEEDRRIRQLQAERRRDRRSGDLGLALVEAEGLQLASEGRRGSWDVGDGAGRAVGVGRFGRVAADAWGGWATDSLPGAARDHDPMDGDGGDDSDELKHRQDGGMLAIGPGFGPVIGRDQAAGSGLGASPLEGGPSLGSSSGSGGAEHRLRLLPLGRGAVGRPAAVMQRALGPYRGSHGDLRERLPDGRSGMDTARSTGTRSRTRTSAIGRGGAPSTPSPRETRGMMGFVPRTASGALPADMPRGILGSNR